MCSNPMSSIVERYTQNASGVPLKQNAEGTVNDDSNESVAEVVANTEGEEEEQLMTRQVTGDTSRRKRRFKVKYYTGSTKYSIVSRVFSSFPKWVECDSEEDEWNVIWLDNALLPEKFAKMKQYQKVNHFIGTCAITRKNFLGRNLMRMKKHFPQAFKFFPSTWILPSDMFHFKKQFNGKKEKTFIIKPDGGSQGRGIYLSRYFEDVKPFENLVAQRYIHKPLLLDNYKFDLRMYVLLTGCSPLRVFLHRDGLIRLATEVYAIPSPQNMNCSTMHLTNYSVNKASSSFLQSLNPEDANTGHKRSLRHVFQKLASSGCDTEKVMEEIEDLVIKTLITIQPSLAHVYNSCQPDDLSNSMCFEILGFDIILDYKFKPWLLEVNHSPSFSIDSEVDEAVKFPVIYDAMRLLNILPEDKYRYKAKLKTQISSRLTKSVTNKNREERIKERELIASELERARSKWEESNCGGYRKIYPTLYTSKYDEYFKTAEQIWESLTGANKKRLEYAKQKIEEQASKIETKQRMNRVQPKGGRVPPTTRDMKSKQTSKSMSLDKPKYEEVMCEEDKCIENLEYGEERRRDGRRYVKYMKEYIYNSTRLQDLRIPFYAEQMDSALKGDTKTMEEPKDTQTSKLPNSSYNEHTSNTSNTTNTSNTSNTTYIRERNSTQLIAKPHHTKYMQTLINQTSNKTIPNRPSTALQCKSTNALNAAVTIHKINLEPQKYMDSKKLCNTL